MAKVTTNTNGQEVIVNESGVEYITSTEQHTNSFGVVLENIGSDETILNTIMYETPMEQKEAERVVRLLVDLFESQTIYNIEDNAGYYVRPEVAKILKEHLGIITLEGMSNDETEACWDVEKEI